VIGDAQRYKELQSLAADWWFRVGFGAENRGNFTVQTENGGVCDIRELLADFALQLPYQQEAAMLSKPDAVRLHEIARHLLNHDPYRRALDDHMRICPGPPVLLFKICPHCGKELA
jgi:hypothetical protein